MLTSDDRQEIEKMIWQKTGFTNRQLGDTPTDALQLIPKRYVDNKFGTPIFDHSSDAGNVTTGETTLYTDTIASNTLAVNGSKLEVMYGGIFVSSGTATRQIKIYFGGTMIFDTGALTLSLSAAWTGFVTLIRVNATTVRTATSFTTEGAALAAYTSYVEVTGLTLSSSNILKITGQAAGVGAATNDIVAKMGSISYFPAAS